MDQIKCMQARGRSRAAKVDSSADAHVLRSMPMSSRLVMRMADTKPARQRPTVCTAAHDNYYLSPMISTQPCIRTPRAAITSVQNLGCSHSCS